MLEVVFIKGEAKQGQISEVGPPLTQGLKFKANQERVWVIQGTLLLNGCF